MPRDKDVANPLINMVVTTSNLISFAF